MPTLADLKYTAEITPYLRQFEQPSLVGISQMQGGSTMGIATPRQQREAQTLRKAAQPVVNAVTDPFYAMTPGVDQRRQDARRRILEKVAAVATDPMAATFAGVGAKMADKAALAKSLEMKAAGVPDREIWSQTGWTHGFPDGKPRFEIDDSGMAYTPNDNVKYEVVGDKGSRYQQESGRMGDLYTHEELFNNYPTTADAEGIIGLGIHSPSGGSYNRLFGVTANGETEKVANYNAIHELQHAVQREEGFATGGSAQVYYPDEAKMIAKETYQKMRPIQAQEGVPAAETYAIAKRYANSVEGGGQDIYKRLAGEVEARLTQRRMNLNAQQRRRRYPIDDMDVKPEDQIVRFK